MDPSAEMIDKGLPGRCRGENTEGMNTGLSRVGEMLRTEELVAREGLWPAFDRLKKSC